MTHVLAHPPIASWLEHRMAHLEPLPAERVRLVGLVVVDPLLADPDAAARASWIADGDSVSALLRECATELGRYDIVAAVTWPVDRPLVSVLIVNP